MNKIKEALANRRLSTFAATQATNIPNVTSLLISPEIRAHSVTKLNELLNLYFDLRNLVRMSHWNIKGMNFKSVHDMLDDIQSELDSEVDVIAEVIVAFGGNATIRCNTTELSNVDISSDSTECLTKLASLFSYVIGEVIDCSNKLDDNGDKVNANTLLELASKLIKFVYLIEKHLQ
jgi:starvation-inducible DNA-binding protein